MATEQAIIEQNVPAEGDRLRVVHALRELIASELTPHDPMPSERSLSERFGVGRTLIRSALKRLTDEGLLRRDGPRMRAITAKARQADTWMRQAVVFLDPLFDSRNRSSQDAYWANYLSLGLGQAVRDAGYHVVALNPSELRPQDVRRLAEEKPVGVLVPELHGGGPQTPQLIQMLVAAGTRVVVYGGDPELAPFDRVMSDHEAGAYQMTRWLIQQGKQQIAHIWPAPANGYWYAPRQAGYERAMREAGLTPRPPILCSPLPLVESESAEDQRRIVFDAAVRSTAGFLVEHMIGAAPLDALMVGTDRDAFAVTAAVRMFGRIPGKDFLVTGYDNYWTQSYERAFETCPPAATVDKCNDRMGHEMVSLLLERVAGRLPEAPQCRQVEPVVVATESVET